ncbi:hypothetical protein ABAC460_03895 [Asticcacaulis sp. AC460]|uniref:META domain-containing protein n=1 Tax=Asticcacaulis sp. AC460 TaxID=1282360 RepID=UPI0003C40C10|nr:META domain-containing protein [Asticcacaulis sp. AC460]ESQ92051.1 hypothetical protein ABAC460_03895 [Asticcacaulis sp. AC460]
MKVLSVLIALPLLAACATDGAAPPLSSGAPAIAGRHWVLVELNGQPVAATAREAYMEINAEAGRVGGSGGCNTFGGSAVVEPGNRVRFSEVASTKMACMQGMDVEQAFFDVLSRADNYSLNGNSLSLNKARMAPLARFEAKE